MKVAYFDCFSGISGDMILGALLDTGLSLEWLKRELEKLPLSGWKIRAQKVKKRGISGTKVFVDSGGKRANFPSLERIVEKSGLTKEIKESSKRILRCLFQAERKVHGEERNLHLHELGNIDTLIDVVGVVTGLKLLGVEEVYSSPLPLGRGMIEAQEGTLPLPAPATLKILEGIPVYGKKVEKELVTPTGAAIIVSLSRDFGEIPPLRIEKIGYGAGEKDLPWPNLLRLILGERNSSSFPEDEIILLESNLDDMNPQHLGWLMELLLEKGSLDVWFSAVQMKKNRPGILLSVLSSPEKTEEILETIFKETTTLGVRILPLRRKKLEREEKKLRLELGEVKVKIARREGKILNLSPSYEDLKKIALRKKIPLKIVYQKVMREILDKVQNENSSLPLRSEDKKKG